jgi:hypothetical protein
VTGDRSRVDVVDGPVEQVDRADADTDAGEDAETTASTNASGRRDARSPDGVAGTGVDALALKPAECDLAAATATLRGSAVETVVVDYEGREHLPGAATLAALADEFGVVATTPVRADGFDPLGDDSLVREWLPEEVGRAVVAGHSAYLSERERTRAVAPRFGAALDRAPDAWVGTESVERVALAAGGPQYELLSRTTERDVRALRAAGLEDAVYLYAPVAVSEREDALLDAVGDYAARRRPVREALPEEASTDATATGRAREVLSAAVRDYALVGTRETVRERVRTLREAGVTRVVGYPARGIETLLSG